MAIFGNNTTHKEIQHQAELGTANTHIAKGAFLKGDIETYGTIRLEGKVLGNITTKGKISIGDSACLEGNLLAQNAEIAGEIRGKVDVVDVLMLKATAVINGNINCNKLIVEAGANFNGKCQMGSIIQEIVINDFSKSTPIVEKSSKPSFEKSGKKTSEKTGEANSNNELNADKPIELS